MPRAKVEVKQRREQPITYGVRSIKELALLTAEGCSLRDIAKAWGMRPLAGAEDLHREVYRAWRKAGSPGAPTAPVDDHLYSPEWNRYRGVLHRAVAAWLRALAAGRPMPEADYVHMANLEREVRDLRVQLAVLTVDPPTDPCVYRCGALGIRPVPKAEDFGHTGQQAIWGYACLECLKLGRSRNIGVRLNARPPAD